MLWRTVVAATACFGLAAAQTFTECDPTKKDCPADPAFGTDHTFHFNATPSGDFWRTTAGNIKYDNDNGAAFTIGKKGDSPTLRTNFYVFWGRTEIWMKAAPGQGVISSVMWLSDDRDEIDWEFVGTKTDETTTNFYSKGVNDYTNGGIHKVAGAPTDNGFHNYTTIWNENSIDWYVDGNQVRSTPAKGAKPGYPQTPMRLSLGIWAGGDSSLGQGTREWAGGDIDYSKGPYTMYVKSVQVTDFTPNSKEYSYGDRSGTAGSIKIKEGNSTAFEALHKEPEKSTGEKFKALPTPAKIAIYAGGASVAAIALGSLIFYYIRQRRLGAAEAKRAEEQAEADRREEQQLARDGINPDSFKEHGQELGKDNYVQVEDTSSYPNEKAWATGAAGAAGAAGAVGAMGAMGAMGRDPRQPPSPTYPPPGRAQKPGYGGHNYSSVSPASPQDAPFDFGVPPPSAAAAAPPMRSQSQGTPSPYGAQQQPYNQMRSATTDGAFNRMGSPGPQQAYGAPPSRTQTPASAMHQQQAYGMQRMQSPAPVRPDQAFGVQRMQSPGPQQAGYNMQRMQSPGPNNGGYNGNGYQQQQQHNQGGYSQNGYYGQGGYR